MRKIDPKEADGVLFEKDKPPVLIKNGIRYDMAGNLIDEGGLARIIKVNEEKIKSIEEKPEEDNEKQEDTSKYVCDKCGFVAKSKFGLLAHKRHCKGE